MEQITKMAFEGSISSIAIATPKAAGYDGGAPSGGSLKLTLQIDQPKPPRLPMVPYQFSSNQSMGGRTAEAWKPRPEGPLKPKKGATDEEKQAAEDALAREQEQYDAARSRWEAEVQVFDRRMIAYKQRQMSYAMLTGIAAVFGGQVLNIVMTPANQDILPGFGVQLATEEELLQLEAGVIDGEA